MREERVRKPFSLGSVLLFYFTTFFLPFPLPLTGPRFRLARRPGARRFHPSRQTAEAASPPANEIPTAHRTLYELFHRV